MSVEELVRLLLMALYLLFAGQIQDANAPPRPDSPPQMLVVESVQAETLGDRTQLIVAGHWPDGCQAEAQADFRQEGNRIDVRVYRFVPPTTDCPAGATPTAQVVTLGVLEPGTYTVRANAFTTTLNLGGAVLATPTPTVLPGQDVERRPVTIENVDVRILESYPMRLHLLVSGYQDDACQGEVFVEQRRAGSTVTVDIFRLHNPMMMCPFSRMPYQETIILEGGFTSGGYVIRVNDYVMALTL